MLVGAKPNYPCSKDCPNRNYRCHATCKAYLEAVEKAREDKKQTKGIYIANEYAQARVRSCLEKRARRRKDGRLHER